jgi:hypothetical protein
MLIVTALPARVAADELEERAVLAIGPLLLVDERETLLVERLEPLVPGDRLESVLACPAGKIDAQHARVVALSGPSHGRGAAAVRLDPAADLVVIGRRPRLGGHVHTW